MKTNYKLLACLFEVRYILKLLAYFENYENQLQTVCLFEVRHILLLVEIY